MAQAQDHRSASTKVARPSTRRAHPPVAADDQPDRRLPDPLEIEVEQLTAGVGRHGRGLVETGPVGQQRGPGPGAGSVTRTNRHGCE